MTVFTSKFPNSAREVVVSWTVPEENSWRKKSHKDMNTFTATECIQKKTLLSLEFYHAFVVSGNFFAVIGVKHAPHFVLLFTSVTKATALAAVSGAGTKRWPVSLERNKKKDDHENTKVQISRWTCTCVWRTCLYMRGALFICSLWGRGAGFFWLATGTCFGSGLLESSSASTLWRWQSRVRVVGHTFVFICEQATSTNNSRKNFIYFIFII